MTAPENHRVSASTAVSFMTEDYFPSPAAAAPLARAMPGQWPASLVDVRRNNVTSVLAHGHRAVPLHFLAGLPTRPRPPGRRIET